MKVRGKVILVTGDANGMERNKQKIIVGKDCWAMDKFCRINVFAAMNLINRAMKGHHGM